MQMKILKNYQDKAEIGINNFKKKELGSKLNNKNKFLGAYDWIVPIT